MNRVLRLLAAGAVFAGLALPGPRALAAEEAIVVGFEEPAGPRETAVFAGGCFWGVEAVFEHVKGVVEVRSGYSGGRGGQPSYEAVSRGRTGHAEAVEVTYDPTRVSYGQLLSVFFLIAHDPTQLDRQGPDHGPQYRSAIFHRSPAQERAERAYIERMTRDGRHGDAPVVTQLVALDRFWPAEDYHQDFARRNPRHPYILAWDAPKLVDLRRRLPGLYRPQGLAAR